MIHLAKNLLIFSFLGLLLLGTSCKKDKLLEDGDAKLRFSADTLIYDTVFVTLGSVTKNLRVYNDYDQPVKISSIRLASGTNFRMNVNGLPGKEFRDVEIRAGDSLWIFAEVTVDPNNSLTPYVISDSIVFETNGNIQDVDLVAWGQNARFYVAKKQNPNLPPYVIIDPALNSVTTWDNILPYVVYGGYAVVDSSTTLNIQAGTQIHFSNNAGLWVYKGGTLNVSGTLQNPVVFQGIRREEDYKEEPGQWDRIWINDGGVNTIDYAIIKNGFIGIQTETLFPPALPVSLQVTNTIIKNMSGLGIFSRNFKISSWNTVVANCGLYNMALTVGGEYEFLHCTLANFWGFGQRGTPAVYLNNYTTDAAGNDIPADLVKANFLNSIIYGANDNELVLDMKNGALSHYQFENCLLKVDNNTPITDTNFVNISVNPAPSFKNIEEGNYELTSPYAQGNAAFLIPLTPPVTVDYNGVTRTIPNPDLGAFEFN